MEITEDLIGSRYRDDVNGPTGSRLFLVTGIDGPDSAVHIRAVDGVVARFGCAKGRPHPDKPAMTVLSISADAAGRSARQAVVTVAYGVPTASELASSSSGPGETEWSVVVSSETTGEDINGNPMIVNYAGRPELVQVGGNWRVQTGYTRATHIVEANVDRPIVRATNRRREAVFPVDEAVAYGGTINSRPWSGFPAKTWLCAGIRGQRDGDGMMVYRDYLYATYLPELGRRTWEFMGETDFGGYRGTDVRLGNGREVFDVYPTLDFNAQGVAVR